MKNLGQFIFEQIKSNQYFNSLVEKLIKLYSIKIIDNKDLSNLSAKEKEDLYRFIDLLANSDIPEARMRAYHLISLLEVFYKETEDFKFYSAAVYSKLGLYALNFEYSLLPFDRRFELEAKKINQGIEDGAVFTDTQFDIYNKMISAPHFSFSGPTSLGKSFIIKKYIKKIIVDSDSNIVVLVPSKALINQFTSDIKTEFSKLLLEKKYVVLNHGNFVEFNTNINYIFILTPERLLSLYSKNINISIDFLFCDEAHKLSNDSNTDVRSLTGYNAIDKTLEKFENTKLVFSSPNISNPEIFLELFGKDKRNSIKVNEAPVTQNLFLIDFKLNSIDYIYKNNSISLNLDILKTVRKSNQLIYKIGVNNSSNMIYCSSREKAIDTAFDFYENIEKRNIPLSDAISDAINKISEFIHDEYYLTKFLEKRIAYHHGQLPHIIRNLIEKLFRDGEINFIFCTPTLVEGVNMPTKNIFINCDKKIRLNKDKTFNPNKTIAFWNLAGRAGRYRKELSGNIFCIQSDTLYRWDDLSIFDKEDNTLLTTIDRKMYTEKSIDIIKKSFNNEENNLKKDDKVSEYFKNILSIDTVRFNDFNKSFLLKRFSEFNREDVIDVIQKKAKKIEDIPVEILDSFKTLDFSVHKKVFEYVCNNGASCKLPKLDYENIKETLFKFYKLYSWNENEKEIINDKTIKKIDYYSVIMNKWISGQSLNSIIDEQIRRTKDIKIDRIGPVIPFDRANLSHVNKVIDEIIFVIEKILTFVFEQYFNHYYKILCHFLGEENAGYNWATYLEFGTQSPIEIGLQSFGLSRHTSHVIVVNPELRKYIITDDNGIIVKVDKLSLINGLRRDSLEYDEISTVL